MDSGTVVNACPAVSLGRLARRDHRLQRHANKELLDLARIAGYSAAPTPTGFRTPVHRPRLDVNPPLFNACVARPVSRKEMQLHPKALAAEKKEVDSLVGKGVLGHLNGTVVERGRPRGQRSRIRSASRLHLRHLR